MSVPERPRTIQSNVDGTKLICAFEHKTTILKRARIEALQIGFCRLLVGAEFRVYADRTDADSALDANE